METLIKLTLETLFAIIQFGVIALILFLLVNALILSAREAPETELRITHLNDKFKSQRSWLKRMLMSPEERRVAERLDARREKSERKTKTKQAKRQLKGAQVATQGEDQAGDLPEVADVTGAVDQDVTQDADQDVTQDADQDTTHDATQDTDQDVTRDATQDGDQDATQDADRGAVPNQESERSSSTPRPRLFVIHFKGDVQASAVDSLREEITAILQIKRRGDEVLLCLHNSGGYVHTHGLAASQLTRIKRAGIKLNVTIDQVAASGGYMMACVGDHITAAPFAIVGSIGVVAQVPNVHRLLKRYDVDVELHTAGEYKRTLTFLGENTDEGREKFKEELHKTHALFQDFVGEQRPALDVERVATGETWYGTSAIEVGLIDEIKTSDEMILEATETHEVYLIEHQRKVSAREKIVSLAHTLIQGRIPEA